MLRLPVWMKCRCILRYIESSPEIKVTETNKIIFYNSQHNLRLSNSVKILYVTTWANSKEIQFLNPYTPALEQKRFKSQKKKRQEDSDESDDEDDHSLDDDFELGKDFKEITVNSSSLRIDAVIKAGLGLARHKAEAVVYDSRVRLNGEKVLKKGTRVNIGDEVDVIKGINSKNENFLDISRLAVKNIMERSNTGKNVLILHRFKAMTIENYPDPWKGPEAE